MLSKITDALAKRKLTGWQVREGRRTSHQSFLALTERECRRLVETQSWVISLHQRRQGPNGQPVLGLSNFRITPPELASLEQRIDEALFAAGLVTNQPFELPGPAAAPDVELADPSIGPKLMDEFEDRLKTAIAKEKNIRLSAAEFFADRVELKLVNHRGLDVSQVETSLHTEFILLSRRGGEEKEFIDRFTRRLSRDFKIEEEVAMSAEQARSAAEAGLPRTGKFPVVLSDEPLDRLFSPLLARASARLKYNRMVDSVPGHDVVETVPGAGDPVTLWSNPLLPGAMGSYRNDGYGTPAQRVCLIEKNKLVRQLADKRYADYLGVPVTGEAGNIEVEAGSRTYDEMLRPAASQLLYHLQAFSAFEPNPITGAFSAEIRSGFEISTQGVRPIKGGSVSGVLQKDLGRARLSRERVQRENVLVPKGVLFEGLTIAGA